MQKREDIMQEIEHCAVNPYFTIKKIAEDLGIAYSTAERAVQKLEAKNVSLG